MPEFFGRKKELKKLQWFFKKATASLIVLLGRRRIGKTTLVEEFAKDAKFYRFSGLAPTQGITHKEQKNYFLKDFAKYFGINASTDDWADIFELLAKFLPDERVVLFFDEVSWLAGSDNTFLPKLKDAWDRHFSKKSKLIFILCGSVSSWIEDHILASTGFVGRVSMSLDLGELSLKECKLFWGNYRKNISNYELLKILSVTGGVPLYLQHIDKTQSAEENIERLCFSPGGLLLDEFNKIFHDVFTNRTTLYKDILVNLTNGAKTIKDLATELEYEIAGRFSEYIHHLEIGGFIKKYHTWNLFTQKTSKLSQVRICDNYVRFFLKYIAQNYERINKNIYKFRYLSTLPNWYSIIALQFENLVINNKEAIFAELQLPLQDIVYENPYFQRKTKKQQGCQIDYLIQTKFNTLYLCEIKFSRKKIGIDVIAEVEKKIKALKKPKAFSIRPVLIHVNGITKNLESEGYFSNIIDFGAFL